MPDPEDHRECPHCKGEGTCHNGEERRACAACARRLLSTWWSVLRLGRPAAVAQDRVGIWCAVCFGRGRFEGATFKITHYFPFAFALLIVGGAMVLLHLDSSSDKVTSALTATIGTIVGFYFGGSGSRRAA